MRVTPLLFVQIFAALSSANVWGAVAEEASFPQPPVLSSASTIAWSTSACCGAFALPVSVFYKFSEDDGPGVDERPIICERNETCDMVEGYISAQHYAFVGFGAGTLADMQLTPLLFVQVSFYCPFQFRAKMSALPAPPTLLCTAAAYRKRVQSKLSKKRFRLFSSRVLYLFLLSLLAGDMELNPGPDGIAQVNLPSHDDATQLDFLRALQSGQAAIMQKLDTIETRFAKPEAMIAEMNKNLGVTQGRIEDVSNLVSQQANVIRSLSQRVDELQEKSVDMEDRSRRLNLVFYGVDDTDQLEKWDQSEKLIQKICKDKLGIQLKSVQRAHRIGRFTGKTKRPIVVNFSSYKEKQDVLVNAKKFKGTNYSVSQDYSPETRSVRKHLWEYGKAKKEDKSNNVKLNFDKLIINDKAFRWDKEKEEVVPVTKP
ncbi:hypothetical protein HPB48_011826 [Haemaphysalis longicornis]|uniref:Uncharacterized protein n=1 Tax=Haemaphysalis longicornis TaxID=44386 RepID=A0A9J6GWB2_HAELO|nr:hypothetical protein HPB48_011826 [Haemaphysalis longicornis]